MGGVLILIAITSSTLLWVDLSNRFIWISLIVTLGFGAIGWVDADEGTACLAVAIRTFWKSAGQLHFGTGAGITWSSDAQAEWRETQLKAAHLTTVAAGSWQS